MNLIFIVPFRLQSWKKKNCGMIGFIEFGARLSPFGIGGARRSVIAGNGKQLVVFGSYIRERAEILFAACRDSKLRQARINWTGKVQSGSSELFQQRQQCDSRPRSFYLLSRPFSFLSSPPMVVLATIPRLAVSPACSTTNPGTLLTSA
jgi:hypothetical protein